MFKGVLILTELDKLANMPNFPNLAVKLGKLGNLLARFELCKNSIATDGIFTCNTLYSASGYCFINWKSQPQLWTGFSKFNLTGCHL